MSKKPIILSVILLVSSASIVYAETPLSTTSAKISPLTRVGIMERKETLKTKIATERAEFKAKLLEIKDQHKKMLVERIDVKLSTINQKGTTNLNSSIERLEKLLNKFSERAAKAKNAGKDTTEVDAAIVAARLAIKTAKDSVSSQSAKTYTADIKDETTLKTTVGKSVSSLRHDLHSVFELVKIAKQKVMDVARALAKLHLENEEISPSASITPTGTITPTTTITPSPTVIPTI